MKKLKTQHQSTYVPLRIVLAIIAIVAIITGVSVYTVAGSFQNGGHVGSAYETVGGHFQIKILQTHGIDNNTIQVYFVLFQNDTSLSHWANVTVTIAGQGGSALLTKWVYFANVAPLTNVSTTVDFNQSNIFSNYHWTYLWIDTE